LQRDRPPQPRVVGEEDHTHSAAPDLAVDFIGAYGGAGGDWWHEGARVSRGRGRRNPEVRGKAHAAAVMTFPRNMPRGMLEVGHPNMPRGMLEVCLGRRRGAPTSPPRASSASPHRRN